MKPNRIERKSKVGLLAVLTLVFFSVCAAGLMFCYDRLKALYLEQCVIRDMEQQVSITSGKMVREDVIAEYLGLKPGANLALIDFEGKRREALKHIYTLREISITRYLPGRVAVVAEERTPVAKLGVHGQRGTTGRVVDGEGMVFVCQRGTQLLPTIYETPSTTTSPGHRIGGRAFAALALVDLSREPDFADLAVQDVDIFKRDYLTATLGNYSKVKISWEGMDEATARSRKALVSRLTNLRHAVRSQLGTNVKVWNATMPDRIFADTQEKR